MFKKFISKCDYVEEIERLEGHYTIIKYAYRGIGEAEVWIEYEDDGSLRHLVIKRYEWDLDTVSLRYYKLVGPGYRLIKYKHL